MQSKADEQQKAAVERPATLAAAGGLSDEQQKAAGLSPSDGLSAALTFAAHAESAGQECMICWYAEACVQFQPSGHTRTCSACAPIFVAQAGLCPMCCASVEGSIMLGYWLDA